MYEVKCRKCRKLIISDTPNELKILDAHGSYFGQNANSCQSVNEENLVFLNEDFLPDWIVEKIKEVQWTKGRLNCPKCDSRIGAFDYISGSKCDCQEQILPSVHVIKSKVDFIKRT